jgi:hypothetical protein
MLPEPVRVPSTETTAPARRRIRVPALGPRMAAV